MKLPRRENGTEADVLVKRQNNVSGWLSEDGPVSPGQ